MQAEAAGARSQPGARQERTTSTASQGRSGAIVGGKKEMGRAQQAEAVGASEARVKKRAKSSASQDPNKAHHVQCEPGSKKRANCCASPVKEDEMLDPKCTFERHDVAAAYAKAPEA